MAKIGKYFVLVMVIVITIGIIQRHEKRIDLREATYSQCAANQRSVGLEESKIPSHCNWAWSLK